MSVDGNVYFSTLWLQAQFKAKVQKQAALNSDQHALLNHSILLLYSKYIYTALSFPEKYNMHKTLPVKVQYSTSETQLCLITEVL